MTDDLMFLLLHCKGGITLTANPHEERGESLIQYLDEWTVLDDFEIAQLAGTLEAAGEPYYHLQFCWTKDNPRWMTGSDPDRLITRAAKYTRKKNND